jgi:hypothetical protein
MQINFAGGAYETFSKNLNAQECVNFYVHIDQEGGVSQLSLRGTPGLKQWVDTGHFAEVRGVHKLGSYLYAVVGNRVYMISSSGVSTLCTGTLETASGYVSMASIAATDTTRAQLMIVDGLSGYVVISTTVTKITDDSFQSFPETVTSQDSYFIVSLRNSGWCYISDVGDGTSWNDTINITAGGYSDNVLAIISDHRDLFLIGEKTFEVFYNSGASTPFAVRPGSSQEVGIGAKHSVVKLDNTIFFLSDNYQIVRLEGNKPVAKSTRSVDYQIAQYETKSDAIGMPINIEGNAFYVLTFPTANKTWCYNAASNFWHQLTSYSNEKRWRGNCAEYFNGKNIVGDYDNGKLYEVDFDTYTDNSELIRRIRATGAIKNEGKNVFHHQLEIFFESGVGLITGQGSDPQAMLQYSDDGGHTWSSELWRSAGKIGKYEWRAVWNRLGASRHRNYRLIVTDPVKWVVTGANLEAEIGST